MKIKSINRYVIAGVISSVLIINLGVFAQDLYDLGVNGEEYMIKGMFEKAEKQLAISGLYKKAFRSDLVKRYPNAKTSQADCVKLINDYLKQDIQYRKYVSDSDIQLYCKPENLKSIFEEENIGKKVSTTTKRYHDSDDKSAFWIPDNINPLMMTNAALEDYRIMSTETARESWEYNNNSSNMYHKYYKLFIDAKIQNVQKQNRPFIQKDFNDALKDAKTYSDLRFKLHDGERYGVGAGSLPSLTDIQETELQTIINEYGEDIFDEQFKKDLNLYRQRQEYMKKQDQKSQQELMHNQQLSVPNLLLNILGL